MSQRAEKKQHSRASILAAAAALLRDKGLPGMSVERAMAGAGLTVGAFYAHFAGKGDLLDHAFSRALDEIGAVMRVSAAGRSGREALRDVAISYLSEAHRDQASQGCPMPAVAASALLEEDDRTLRHLVAEGLLTLCQRVSAIGGAEISSDRALSFTVLLIGGQIVARATRGTAISSKVLAASRDAVNAVLQLA